jgi:hypothetical protein
MEEQCNLSTEASWLNIFWEIETGHWPYNRIQLQFQLDYNVNKLALVSIALILLMGMGSQTKKFVSRKKNALFIFIAFIKNIYFYFVLFFYDVHFIGQKVFLKYDWKVMIRERIEKTLKRQNKNFYRKKYDDDFAHTAIPYQTDQLNIMTWSVIY